MGDYHAAPVMDATVDTRTRAVAKETCADLLAGMLAQLGVRRAFGVLGGGIAQFHASLRSAGIEVVHARHEAGAAFMATEAHFASDRPVVVFTTTGPGATNALTGLVSAAWDGAKIITVVGGTDSHQRGRAAFQETGPQSMNVGAWVDTANVDTITLEDAAQMSSLYRRMRSGLRKPGGYLLSLTLPLGVQTSPAAPIRRVLTRRPQLRPSVGLISGIHELLRDGNFVMWLGFGARKHAAAIRELAERSGAFVMSSARAKGVFPESHPQYLGVTSMFGGHARVRDHMQMHRPRHVLVLGSRLGQATSSFDDAFAPSESFIHVDVDPSVFGLAYPDIKTVGVHAEIGPVLDALVHRFRRCSPPVIVDTRPTVDDEMDDAGPVHPRALMAAIQRVVVERSDAIVLTEAGNSFAWGNAELRFDQPGRYRTTSGFAAMTSATAGVVGAAIGSGRPAVAIAGDGAMLMANEVSTAVEHRVDAKWVVLNDASYGMVHHGMVAVGLEPRDTTLPRTNFEMLAVALGATGMRVTRASELDDALQRMLATPGPVILDVAIDPRPAPPFGRRNSVLSKGWE